MQYLEKCSYQQIARIRSILFIVNVLFVLSIIFFRSPAYIFLALIFIYPIAIFSDRLKQYVMVEHEIASRCVFLLERKDLAKLGLNNAQIDRLMTLDDAGRFGFLFDALSNNRANVVRICKHIRELEATNV